MSKPETRFYSAVHKLLPKEIHREKMHNPYRGGTADVWYSAAGGDLWVEYKWIAKLNKKADIRVNQLLSPLQLHWLRGRHEEGRNVVVILGTPEGAWVYERLSWEKPLDPNAVRQLNATKHDVANYIRRRICLNADSLVVQSHDCGWPDLQAPVRITDDGSNSQGDTEETRGAAAVGLTAAQ